MAESSLKGQKTLGEKKKLLVTSNFFFSPSVFKRLVLQTGKNQGLLGKWLNYDNSHSMAETRRNCIVPSIHSFLINSLYVCCLKPFPTLFQLYRSGQCTYPCSPGVLFAITHHYILSKPLAAFPYNHLQING